VELLIVGYFRMIGSLMTTLEVEPDLAWAARALDQAHGTARATFTPQGPQWRPPR
jgi:hypothetical protein